MYVYVCMHIYIYIHINTYHDLIKNMTIMIVIVMLQ